MIDFFKKNWHVWILAIVVIAAFFIRTWSLEDTLYFKMDQSRDSILVKNAFDQGPGMLPLLGPRAAGTFLRLGPVAYYFQYMSAIIVKSAEPVTAVYPEIIFSLLTIPLFFVFLRQFFRKGTSVIVSSLFGFSFLMTQFSRFAWNPNQTPFWSLLLLLSVFKVSTHSDRKKAGWWLICAAAAYGVLSQLHFTALLAFPIVIILFWLFYRPRKIKLVFWCGAIATLLFFYIPMGISEVFTGGDNADQFIYALTHKSKESSLKEKVEDSLALHGKYYALSLTSYGNTKDGFFRLMFYFMVAFAFWRSFQIWREEKSSPKIAFLVLIGCWFVVFFLLYTKLSATVLKPRFWLLTAAIPYVFLGLFLEWLYRKGHRKRGRAIAGILISFLFVANSYAVGYWYWTLSQQKTEAYYVRDLELKQGNLVGMKQMNEAMDHMILRSNETGKTICYSTDNQYKKVYKYLLVNHSDDVSVERISFSRHTNDHCIFFAIKNGGNSSKPKLPDEYKDFFTVVEKESFGVVVVWEILMDEQAISSYINNKKQQTIIEEQEEVIVQKEDEVFLEGVEGAEEAEEINVEEENEVEDENDDDEEDDEEEPGRKERVFWKHVFGAEYQE